MPYRPAGPCAHPGCPALAVDRHRCADHQRIPFEGSTRKSRLPSDWRRIRQRILERDGFRCQMAGPRCTVLASDVDHIIPGDDHRPTNLQALCQACHRTKTAKEARHAR